MDFGMYSEESEAEVVGMVLCGGAATLDTAPELRPEHFFNAHLAAAFGAAIELAAAGMEINLFSVRDWLEAHNNSGMAPTDMLADVAANCVGGSIAMVAGIVIERSKARAASRIVMEFAAEMHDSKGANVNTALPELVHKLDELDMSREDNEATFDALELMRIGVHEFDRRYRAGGEPVGLTTGIDSLDEKLLGLQNGSLYVLAGRPAMGKTAVSMSIAESVADRCGTVLVFNLEMSKEQLALRSLAAASEVSLGDLQKGNDDNGGNWTKLSEGLSRVKNAGRKMFVDVRSTISIAQIRSKARQIKNRHGLKLVVIDYLQLIDESRRRFKDDTARVTWLSRQCKILAKELDVPVILLSQLSRECEKRQDKRPVLSDLRDSGAIEQDADAVIFTYRHGYYSDDREDTMLELIVAKQRMGETGTAYSCFEGKYSRIANVSDGYVDWILNRRNAPKQQEQKHGRSL